MCSDPLEALLQRPANRPRITVNWYFGKTLVIWRESHAGMLDVVHKHCANRMKSAASMDGESVTACESVPIGNFNGEDCIDKLYIRIRRRIVMFVIFEVDLDIKGWRDNIAGTYSISDMMYAGQEQLTSP